MPLRPVSRDQAWLPPPTLDDLLPQDHPGSYGGLPVDGCESHGPHQTLDPLPVHLVTLPVEPDKSKAGRFGLRSAARLVSRLNSL